MTAEVRSVFILIVPGSLVHHGNLKFINYFSKDCGTTFTFQSRGGKKVTFIAGI